MPTRGPPVIVFFPFLLLFSPHLLHPSPTNRRRPTHLPAPQPPTTPPRASLPPWLPCSSLLPWPRLTVHGALAARGSRTARSGTPARPSLALPRKLPSTTAPPFSDHALLMVGLGGRFRCVATDSGEFRANSGKSCGGSAVAHPVQRGLTSLRWPIKFKSGLPPKLYIHGSQACDPL
jgi:hypothetical protein